MNRNDSTLPDDADELLVIAGHRADGTLDAAIVDHLRDPAARRRILALRAARRRRLLDDERWCEALSDADASVRREALSLVAGEPDVAGPIIDQAVLALSDEDPLVVDAAAFALGEHLWTSGVDALVTVATGHDDARCREAAIAALGAIGDDRARAAIMTALADKPAVRRRAIVALANFDGPDIDAALERAREDRDWQVRAAVDQLGRSDLDAEGST